MKSRVLSCATQRVGPPSRKPAQLLRFADEVVVAVGLGQDDTRSACAGSAIALRIMRRMDEAVRTRFRIAQQKEARNSPAPANGPSNSRRRGVHERNARQTRDDGAPRGNRGRAMVFEYLHFYARDRVVRTRWVRGRYGDRNNLRNTRPTGVFVVRTATGRGIARGVPARRSPTTASAQERQVQEKINRCRATGAGARDRLTRHRARQAAFTGSHPQALEDGWRERRTAIRTRSPAVLRRAASASTAGDEWSSSGRRRLTTRTHV